MGKDTTGSVATSARGMIGASTPLHLYDRLGPEMPTFLRLYNGMARYGIVTRNAIESSREQAG